MSKIENRALVELVYEKIKYMIDEGVLQPGEKVNKGELVEKLGVSQTPINEALNKLAGEKILEQRSRQGFFIRQYSYLELSRLFELRASIEGMAARLCVEQLQEEGLNHIVKIFDNFVLPLSEQGAIDYLHADKIFHESLVKYSGNSFLVETSISSGYLLKSNQKGLLRSAEETLPEHMALIGALKNRDAPLAQELTIMHLLKTRDLLRKIGTTGTLPLPGRPDR
ncbi:GntR family transcriptional regulator [Spirochaetia bacterium]|nr:GntR family transcriptional regulator [Spirochaetia bacterium]